MQAADTTAPTIITFNVPSTSSGLTVSLTLAASDTVGVTGYCLKETAGSTGCTWSSTAPTSYVFSSSGSKTLYAYAKDAAGNISAASTASITVTVASGTADLALIKMSGWSDKLVVATSTGANTDSSIISSDSTVYLSMNYVNQGTTATTSTFYIYYVYLDNKLVRMSQRTTPFNLYSSGNYSSMIDLPVGKLSAGIHTVKVVLDPLDAIAESDETNNTFTKTFTVSPGSAAVDPLDSWNNRTSDTANTLRGIAYGKSTFVAVGDAGTILTSATGTGWVTRSSGTASVLNGITYGNSGFVAVGASGTIITSADGINWSAKTSGTTNTLFGVTYVNSLYIALGTDGTILTSVDGTSWVSNNFTSIFPLYSVAFGNNIFVGVGTADVIKSSDGSNWSGKILIGTAYGIAFGNGLFFTEASGKIRTSPDGDTWTGRAEFLPDLRAMAYANSTFIASGDEGLLTTSSDGITWTVRLNGLTGSIRGLVYGNNSIVAVGDNGSIIQSGPLASVSCTYTPSATSATFDAKGGTGAINITASPYGCTGTWSALTSDSWVTITSGTTGTSDGTVSYSVASNASVARVGTISVAGQNFSVMQSSVVTSDTTAPTVTNFNVPSTSSGLTVSLTLAASDAVGVTGYCLKETAGSTGCTWSSTAPTSYVFSSSGSKTLYAYAKDAAGNVSTPSSAAVIISTTPSKPGDCDNNGTVAIAEVQNAINMFLGIQSVAACVDMDATNTVSISEVQKVINSFLGL